MLFPDGATAAQEGQNKAADAPGRN